MWELVDFWTSQSVVVIGIGGFLLGAARLVDRPFPLIATMLVMFGGAGLIFWVNAWGADCWDCSVGHESRRLEAAGSVTQDLLLPVIVALFTISLGAWFAGRLRNSGTTT